MHLNAQSEQYSSVVEPRTRTTLSRVHFTSGPITLAEFIELLIVEFAVLTRVPHDEAIAILRAGRSVGLEA